MSERKRYIYRILVDGAPVRHYQTLRAAQHRAAEWSRRPGYEDEVIFIERSQPVAFEGECGDLWRSGAYKNGGSL